MNDIMCQLKITLQMIWQDIKDLIVYRKHPDDVLVQISYVIA